MKDQAIPAKSAAPADIEAVMAHYGLKEASQIRFLRDEDLRVANGIGPAKVARLRADFPFDEAARNTQEAIEERWRLKREARFQRLLAAQREKPVEIGDLFQVRGVHFVDRAVVVARGAGRLTFHVIEILWKPEVPDEERVVKGCFGREISAEEIREVPSFPTLYGVTEIEIMPGSEFHDFRTSKVRIKSESGTFSLTLFMPNDGESPLGVDRIEGFTAHDFLWELKQDPTVAEVQQRAARGLELAARALFLDKITAAVKAYVAAKADIASVLTAAQKLADVRGVEINHEVFGLTQTDVDTFGRGGADIPAEDLFPALEGEPYAVSPMSVVQDIMRTLVDRGDEKRARKAVAAILDASPWMVEQQRSRLLHCLTILDDFAAIRRVIEGAGAAGVTRKSIVEGVNQRFEADGGMARRAVQRWLDGGQSGFLKVSTPKGVVFRVPPATAV